MRATGVLLAVLLLVLPLLAQDGEEKDPRKVFLKGIGKAVKSGSWTTVAGHFPEEGKVELRLRGIQPGRYRDKQARSLLASWFGKIEVKKAELKEIRGSVGVFRLKYRLREDGTRVEGQLNVSFVQRGESWLIVGIVES
jgi:hypothetical protein